MCVATIGLAAMMAVRVERRGASESADLTAARFLALSAIEKGFQTISDNSSYRDKYGANSVWFGGVLERGKFSLSVSDPDDGSIIASPNNSLVFTGTGEQGKATYSLQVTVTTSMGGYEIQNGTWQQVIP